MSAGFKPGVARPARLYMLMGSHPANAGRLMLEAKGMDYKIVSLDKQAGLHDLRLRAAGFRRGTVPALKIGGRKVEGTREIARALDEIQPDPPLLPADADARRAVEEAEAWGHDILQPVPRRIVRASLVANAYARREFLGYMGLPPILAPAMLPVLKRMANAVDATPARAQADLAGLRALVDHVDGLLAAGVLGGSPLTAADFQIAPSLRFLLTMEDVRPLVDGGPAAAFARAVSPEYMDPLPVGIVPAGWVPMAPVAP